MKHSFNPKIIIAIITIAITIIGIVIGIVIGIIGITSVIFIDITALHVGSQLTQLVYPLTLCLSV
jgi:hypothetical protein